VGWDGKNSRKKIFQELLSNDSIRVNDSEFSKMIFDIELSMIVALLLVS
jgi:hypothetical protein